MVVKSHPKVFAIIVCSMYSLMNIINFPHIHCDGFPLQFSIVIETQCLDCNGFLMPPACKQIATHIANSVLQIKKLLINYGHYHIFCPGVIMTIPENQSVWSVVLLLQDLIRGFIQVKLVHNYASSVAKSQFSFRLKLELLIKID